MNRKVLHEEQYIISLICFLVAGIITWPSKNTIKNILFKFYSYFSIFLIVLFVPMDIYTLIYTNSSDKIYLKAIEALFIHAPLSVKVIFFKFKSPKFEKVMVLLENEKRFFKNEELQQEFQNDKRTSKRFSIIYAIAIFGATIIYTVPPIFAGLFKLFTKNSYSNRIELAFPAILPYDTETSAGYLAAALQMLLQTNLASFSYIGTDVLITNLMKTVSCHLRCLALEFKSISKNNDKDLSVKKFKRTIKQLLKLYEIQNDIEEIQNLLIFTLYLSAIGVISIGLYKTSVEFSIDGYLIKTAGFFVTVLIQPFLYCWIGDIVTREAENVRNALWESNWVGSDLTYQKLMLITMIRLNKPLVFTGGKLIHLSNATFLSIVNSSYSAFNLLNHSNHYN